MPNLRNGSKGGFEPGLTRLRVRHSTTELPRSTTCLCTARSVVGNNGQRRDKENQQLDAVVATTMDCEINRQISYRQD